MYEIGNMWQVLVISLYFSISLGFVVTDELAFTEFDWNLNPVDKTSHPEFKQFFPSLALNQSLESRLQYLNDIQAVIETKAAEPPACTERMIAKQHVPNLTLTKQEYAEIWDEKEEESYYFRNVNLDSLPKAPQGKMIETVLQLLEKKRKKFGDEVMKLQKGRNHRIVTMKQMLSLPEESQPAIVISEDELKLLRSEEYRDQLLHPARFHGIHSCEAMAIFVNLSYTSPSRAKECALQLKYRLLAKTKEKGWKEAQEDLFKQRKLVDKADMVHVSSLGAVYNARVRYLGEIQYQNYDIQPISSCEFCFERTNPVGGNHNDYPQADIVLVASKIFGIARFHDFFEATARALPYIEEIKQRNDTQIYFAGGDDMGKKFLMELGIPEDKFIRGVTFKVMDARVALFPTPSSTCYFPGVLAVRRFHATCIKFMEESGAEVPGTPKIMVIHRWQGSRQLSNHDELLETLRREVPSHEVTVFGRGQVANKSFKDIMTLFYEADVIVAPHGMGEAYIIACRPGTIVIEFQPYNSPVMCFVKIAQTTGLHYHSIILDRTSHHDFRMQVDTAHAARLVKAALREREKATAELIQQAGINQN